MLTGSVTDGKLSSFDYPQYAVVVFVFFLACTNYHQSQRWNPIILSRDHVESSPEFILALNVIAYIAVCLRVYHVLCYLVL